MNDWVDRPCPCSSAGDCPHYGKVVSPRVYELSRDSGPWGLYYRKQLAGVVAKPPKIALPPLLRRAGNAAVAGAAIAASGFARVPAEEQSRRTSLCVACVPPDGYYQDGICTHPECGCPMVRKTPWAAMKCPVGKW